MHMSKNTVYALIREGKLTAYRYRGGFLISKADIIDYMAAITDDEYRRVFDLTAKKGIAVEINIKCLVGHQEQFAANLEQQPHLRMFRIAKDCGCRFTFGTDCHFLSAQRMIRFAPQIAALLELEPEDLHPLMR